MKRDHILRAVILLAVCTTCMAGLSDGLVAYYPFNGNADDASGNNHHGGVFGALLTGGHSGVPGTAYNFDGVNDYVTVPYSSDFQLQEFTVGAWIQPADDSYITSAVIAGRGEDSTTDRASYIFDIAPIASRFGVGLRLLYEDNGDTERYFAYGYYPPVGTWTHLATTRSSSGEVGIYVNGVLQQQWASSATVTTQCFQDFTIGARHWNPTGSPPASGPTILAGFFPGVIDEVRLYNRALTAEEIDQLATIPLPSAFVLGCLGLGLIRRYA